VVRGWIDNMKKTIKTTIILIILIGSSILIVYFLMIKERKEKQEKISFEVPLEVVEKRKEYCYNNFNLNEVINRELKKHLLPTELSNKLNNLFAEYITCKAVQEREIKVCEQLYGSKYFLGCERCFYTYNFFEEVEKKGECNNRAIQSCVEFVGRKEEDSLNEKITEEHCRNFCRAYLQEDTNICSQLFPLTEKGKPLYFLCQVVISKEKKYCDNFLDQSTKDKCLDIWQYFFALGSKKEENCETIKNPSLKTICNLYFISNPKILCENRLKLIRDNYCHQWAGF